MRLGSVLPDTARVNGAGHLEVGGCDAVELAREFGTPLFVCDEATVRDRLARYGGAFGPENVHYAAKAFLTVGFAQLVASEGVGMDCASGGELYTALRGGFPAGRVVLHGNNKSRQELEEALGAGVGLVVVDSVEELEELDLLARRRGVRQPVLLRVTPGVEAHTHEYLRTGVEDTKFGVPIGRAALAAVERAAGLRGVELRGLHCHVGSQVLSVGPFAEAARRMAELLREARRRTGLALPLLDVGGGLGIAYEPSDAPPSIEELGGALLKAAPDATLKVEPGRSVVGPAMVTLYTAGVQKEVPGVRRYVSVDGGMSENIRPALYQARYTFLSAERPEAAHDRTYAVAGKLCETGDLLAREAHLPELRPGEVLACAATGAYGYAMASNYNKQPRPAVVLVGGGRARLLARRETYEDLVRLEC